MTIEDAAELQLLQPHVVRLETRPPNIEGKGEVTQRDLVRNALRMRPDRIVVGEVRGQEVMDMLQAMNTGHDGSLTTVHANSPRDALHRLETLMLLSGVNLPPMAMREQISAGLDVVVHVVASGRRNAPRGERLRDRRHGGRSGEHAGHLRLQEDGHLRGRQGARTVRGDGDPAQVCRPARGERSERAGLAVPRRPGDLMDTQVLIPSIGAFLAVVCFATGLLFVARAQAAKRIRNRLQDVILLGERG